MIKTLTCGGTSTMSLGTERGVPFNCTTPSGYSKTAKQSHRFTKKFKGRNFCVQNVLTVPWLCACLYAFILEDDLWWWNFSAILQLYSGPKMNNQSSSGIQKHKFCTFYFWNSNWNCPFLLIEFARAETEDSEQIFPSLHFLIDHEHGEVYKRGKSFIVYQPQFL